MSLPREAQSRHYRACKRITPLLRVPSSSHGLWLDVHTVLSMKLRSAVIHLKRAGSHRIDAVCSKRESYPCQYTISCTIEPSCTCVVKPFVPDGDDCQKNKAEL